MLYYYYYYYYYYYDARLCTMQKYVFISIKFPNLQIFTYMCTMIFYTVLIKEN